MKPIHLNLASRPYRDYRPVYAVVVLLSLLTAFLMLNNIDTYYRYTHETRNTRAKIEQLKVKATEEQQREQIAVRQLRSMDLTHLDARTRFINAKLAERAFSWSSLLDELESAIDRDVRLLTIAPSFNEDGSIQLSLTFQAKTGEGMIKTINRLNADPQFSNTFPHSESVIEGGYQFDLTSRYQPPQMRVVTRISDARRTR